MRRKITNAGTSAGVKKAWESRHHTSVNEPKSGWEIRSDAHRRKMLDTAMKEDAKNAPNVKIAQKKILSLGGMAVRIDKNDPDLADVVAHGKLHVPEPSDVKLVRGNPSNCHWDAAERAKKNPNLNLVTGFALRDDGFWGPHTWTQDKNTGQIQDTFTKRLAYFGVTPNASKFRKSIGLANTSIPLAIKNTASALLPAKASPKTIRATLRGLLNAYLPETVAEPPFALLNAVIGRWKANPVVVANASVPHKRLGVVPTPKQKEKGNYRKQHRVFCGLNLTLENIAESTRSGIGADGKVWVCVIPANYGYLNRSPAGADGENVDVYLSTNPSESSPVFCVDQMKLDGTFDEHKFFLGWDNEKQVRDTYLRAFSDGKAEQRLGAVTQMSIDEFKALLKNGDLSKPVAGQFPKPNKFVNARAKKSALKKRLLNSFEGHEGRPGERGGSLPKGESSPHPITWHDVKENLDRESRFSRGRKSDDQIHLETLSDFEDKPAGEHVLKLANGLNDDVHKLMDGIPFNQKDLSRRLLTSQALFDDNPDGVWPIPVYISAKNDPNTVGLLLAKDGKKEMFEGNDEATPETMDLVNEALGIGDKHVRVYTSQPADVIAKIKAGEYPEGIFVSPDKSHAASYWGEGRDLTSFKMPLKHIAQHSEVDWQIRPHKV